MNQDLRAINENLNRLVNLRNECDMGRRSCTDQEYVQLVSDIRTLYSMRDELLNASRFGNMQMNNFGGTNLSNTGYIDPRWQQNNGINIQSSGLFTNNSQVSGFVPSVIADSNVSDNKYASKASGPLIQNQQPAQQQPIQNAVVVEPNKPAEGSEYILTVGPGLECRKEVNNGWFRYEVYGNINTVTDAKTDNLSKSISLVSDAKKHCLTKKLDGVIGKMTRYKYGNGSADVTGLTERLATSDIIDGLMLFRDLDGAASKYLDHYFTSLFNKLMAGGMKKKLRLDSLIGDLDDMNAMISKEAVRLQTYYSNIKSSIKHDLNNNISLSLKDGIYTLVHETPYIYIESSQVLGDVEKVMLDNDICCVKEESNKSLFNVLKSYFDNNTDTIHVMLYSMDNLNKVSRYIVCQDIYNNFILAK